MAQKAPPLPLSGQEEGPARSEPESRRARRRAERAGNRGGQAGGQSVSAQAGRRREAAAESVGSRAGGGIQKMDRGRRCLRAGTPRPRYQTPRAGLVVPATGPETAAADG